METETLSLLARARLPTARRVLRSLLGTPAIRDRLAASRAASVGLDRDLAAMLRLDDLSHGSPLHGLSAATARLRTHEQILIVDEPGPAGVEVRDLELAGPAGPMGARLYEPEGLARPSPGIVYIHGGGFVTCSVDTHDGVCRRLALGARARVVSLDYRRAPEHRFPAAVDDALAGTRWVLAEAEQLGIDPSRVAVAGDSAGGNLSAVISLRTRRDPRRLKLAVLVYPATDATSSLPSHARLGSGYFLTRENIEWYYGHYVPEPEMRKNPDASPLFAEDVSGAPRTLVVVAAFDPLLDEGLAYAERLRQQGVPVEIDNLGDMVHGFLLMTAACPAAGAHARRLAERIGAELRSDGG